MYLKKELLEWLEVIKFLAYKLIIYAYTEASKEARNAEGSTIKKWRIEIGWFFLICIFLYAISILTIISIPFQIILIILIRIIYGIYRLFVLTKNRIKL